MPEGATATATAIRRIGFLRRLYRGETQIDFIGRRKKWYLASGVIIAVCLLSIIVRQFNLGIEFSGGNQYLLPVKPGTSIAEVRGAVENVGVTVESAQTAGNTKAGGTEQYVIRTPKLDNQNADATQITRVKTALARAGHVQVKDITTNEVSSSWGSEVTNQALIALAVFLIAVSIFMWIRFREIKVAGAAVLALVHDLILTAGIYSLVGFEVTPGTVVGLLTILGYSLYDTVVVFDRVDENTRGLLGTSRYTYGEAANMAVNQTLMRSINTSLIGLLPVAGLLFVGAGLLGVGTLEDLALVLFVGMITGAYSSLFLATPWLVDFKMFDPRYRNHANRVLTKRAGETKGATKAPVKGRPAGKAAAGRTPAKAGAAKAAGARPTAAKAAKAGAAASSAATSTGAKAAGAKAANAGSVPARRRASAPEVGDAPVVGAVPEVGALPEFDDRDDIDTEVQETAVDQTDDADAEFDQTDYDETELEDGSDGTALAGASPGAAKQAASKAAGKSAPARRPGTARSSRSGGRRRH
jgi:preprotein translocase subunit SecF